MRVARSLRKLRRSFTTATVRTAAERFRAGLSGSVGENCKPKSQQVREMVQLALRRSFSPEEYFAYRFFEKGKDL